MSQENTTEIQIGGRSLRVPAVRINERTVIAMGNWLKIASIMDDEFEEGGTIASPDLFIAQLNNTGVKSDLFTFVQKLPDVSPRFKYHLEWDNAAVIPINSFSDWWDRRIEGDVRKAVKRAKRLGVTVKLAQFNDTFVEGIRGIYNESPVRQGTTFWHYQKDFDTVKRENSTFLDRSAYIGAYFNDELIGFIRMVYVEKIAMTLQVICKKQHFDKKPTNALIAKAVEVCELNKVTHLVYGSYLYNDAHTSLTEFKRRNGFEQVLLPRYYMPLTLKGKMALNCGLHHPLLSRIPKSVLAKARKIRSVWRNRLPHSISEAS